jgi:tetratricopeptide (TPR) repeat protein
LDDLDRARDEIAIALRTLPNNARLFEWSGYIDRRQSRWPDAFRNLDRALELDPRNPHILIGSWVAYSLTRNYTRAREICDRLMALEPDDVKYRFTCTWNDFYQRADIAPWHAVLNKVLLQDATTYLADGFYFNFCERDGVAANRALELLGTLGEETLQARGMSEIQITRTCARGVVAWMKGDTAAAQAAFVAARPEQEEVVRKEHATVERLHPRYSYEGSALSILGLIDAGLGRKDDALREGRRALELTSLETNSFAGADVRYFYAVICAWTGEPDLAIKQLQDLINVPIGLTYGDLKLSPYWEALRDDPRFEKLVEEAKEPVALKPSPSVHGE